MLIDGIIMSAPVGAFASAARWVASSGVRDSAGTGVTGGRVDSFLSGLGACVSDDRGTAGAAAARAIDSFPVAHAPRTTAAIASSAAANRHPKFAFMLLDYAR